MMHRNMFYETLVYLQITTGYNLEDDRCECVALQDYKENEQVKTRSSIIVLALFYSHTLISNTIISS